MAEVQARIAARRAAEPAIDREGLRRAGVLVPLFVREGKLWILLTRRTESVEHHRGQISFPGGGEEETDESLYATALRESELELSIIPADVIALGPI